MITTGLNWRNFCMNKDLIEKINSKSVTEHIEQLVESACASDNNIFGYGIWTHHIKDVVRIGKELAKIVNADSEIVEIAALLHDYSGIRDHSLHKEHHIHSANDAEKILKELNYPEDKISAVKHCIETHRGSVKANRLTPEAECLANADAIAHIENVSSLFYLAYFKHGMQIDKGKDWIYKKLQRSWKKINSEFHYLIEKKYKSALEILDNNDGTNQ